MTLTSTLLVVLAFAPGREVSVPVTGPNPGVTSVLETVARPDGGFFVTWYDGRSFPSNPPDFVPLRAGRLVGSTLLDPTGVALPVGTASVSNLRAVHLGDSVELIFIELGGGGSPNVVHAVRVAEDGTVLRPDVPLASTTNDLTQLHATFDGVRTVVTWLENDSKTYTGSWVRVVGVTPAGATSSWTLATSTSWSLDSLSSTSAVTGETLVTWVDGLSPLKAARIPRGSAPGLATTLHAGDDLSAVAVPGGGWFTAWSEYDAGVVSVKAAMLEVDGGSSSPVTVDATTSMYAVWPRVAFDGTGARVVWTNYLDIKSRTVPLRSAPTSATQVLRSGLPFEPGVALGCSNGTCLVSWEESLPQGAFGGNALLSRLGGTSAMTDVPPFEVSFPADEQGAPTIVSDGVAHTVVFTRALGRQPRELAVRRLADDGHWLDPAPVVLGQRYQPLAVAPLVDGGVLVAATFSPTLGIDDALYGFRVDTATGAATDAGIWFSASFQPWHVALACTATRCGLLADSGNGVLSSVVSPGGVKLSSSNVYLSFLSSATAENLVAVGSRFVALYSTATDQLAAVADEAAFPTFGTPAPLAPGVTNGCVPMGIVTTGTDLAAFFTERDTCKTMARVVDTLTGQPKGSVLTVRQCAAGAGGSAVRGVVRHGTGFSVLVQDLVTLPGGAYQTDTVLLELDASLQLVSQQVLDSRAGADTLPVSFTRVGTHPVVALASFDATAGILSTRAWLSGLDALDGGAVDAGRPDAGGADAGAPDASVAPDAGQPQVDAGPSDAGQSTDAGQPDAGTSAPGTSTGCGCSSVDGALLLAATMLLGRRRRQL